MLPNWTLQNTEKTHHIAIPEDFTITYKTDPVDRGDFLVCSTKVRVLLSVVEWCNGLMKILFLPPGDSEQMEGLQNMKNLYGDSGMPLKMSTTMQM